MQFNIKYSRMGCKFFFISNLTEWHFSCRKNYNKSWLDEIGELTVEEREKLSQFKEILQKYDFKKYLGIFFITNEGEEKVWSKLQDNVSKKEFEEVKKVFDVFESKFVKVWKPQKLERNIKILEKEINKTMPKVLGDLEVLFGKVKRKKFDVYLLQHSYDNKSVSGGANLGNKGITVECNQLSVKEKEILDNLISVTYHELLHMLFNKKILTLVGHFYNDNKNSDMVPYRKIKSLANETVVHLFFSYYGFLSNKYFYKHSKQRILNSLDRFKKVFEYLKTEPKSIERNEELELYFYIAISLYPVIEEYLKNKRKIDKKFVGKVVEFLKK